MLTVLVPAAVQVLAVIPAPAAQVVVKARMTMMTIRTSASLRCLLTSPVERENTAGLLVVALLGPQMENNKLPLTFYFSSFYNVKQIKSQ